MANPRNFTEYFKTERDVYIQNVSNAQLSLEFHFGDGRVEGFTVPPGRDPINLTQFIPFVGIKNSMDFRKMLSRRPAALQLLDEEQYTAFYSSKAMQMNLPDADAAIDAAEERRRRVADKTLRENVTDRTPEKIHEVTESGTGPNGMPRFGERQRVTPSETFSEDEVINPRVLHLCNQVKAEIEEAERMPANELLFALQDLPILTMDDYEHVRSHGFYKTVKKWAKGEMSKLVSKDDDDENETESAQA